MQCKHLQRGYGGDAVRMMHLRPLSALYARFREIRRSRGNDTKENAVQRRIAASASSKGTDGCGVRVHPISSSEVRSAGCELNRPLQVGYAPRFAVQHAIEPPRQAASRAKPISARDMFRASCATLSSPVLGSHDYLAKYARDGPRKRRVDSRISWLTNVKPFTR